ncbi:MAG: PEP-CTERM sorting domain-containing protein [Armatimonadetes bacterium]|nr:PEP-CTERM sorting domain-containing protein [Armatimonadota bacterium]
MRFPTTSIVALAVMATAISGVRAGTYSFQPTPADLYDLDHYKTYTWGIDFTIPSGETITDATLTIKNINNWKYEPNANWLYIRLQDNPPLGVVQGTDNQASGDAFAGTGTLVAVYTDNSTKVETLNYKFGPLGLLPTLNNYAADGRFGFSFDPDCHYFNDGIKFTLTTKPTPQTPVPEPVSMALTSLGLGALGLIRKGRKA